MPQHLEALARANEIRLARSRLKHELRDRELELSEVLEHPAVERMPIIQLLKALPRWGTHRAARALTVLEIGQLRYVGDLTARERECLLATVQGLSDGNRVE